MEIPYRNNTQEGLLIYHFMVSFFPVYFSKISEPPRVKSANDTNIFVPVLNFEFLNAIETGEGKAAFIQLMAWSTIRLSAVPKYAESETGYRGKCLYNFITKFVS